MSRPANRRPPRYRSSRLEARRLGAELLEDRRLLAVLTTGTGDGNLTVTVDGYGSFGDAVGLPDNTGALYDPIGPVQQASTTFESGVAFRLGSSGTRDFLTSGNIYTSGGLPAPTITGDSTTANSTFSFDGLNFALTQTVSQLFDTSNVQTGSILTQRYVITNPGNSPLSFETVRYLDGDLYFDQSLIDGGGRLISNGDELLFETDASGSASVDTTFVGIDSNGGTAPATDRFEVSPFPSLEAKIVAGEPLDGAITGDHQRRRLRRRGARLRRDARPPQYIQFGPRRFGHLRHPNRVRLGHALERGAQQSTGRCRP